MGFKKLRNFKIFILLLILAIVLPVQAFSSLQGDVQELEPLTPVPIMVNDDVMIDETPNLWFVELSGRPVAEGTSVSAVNREQAQFRSNAKKAGINYKERFSYNTLFNGFSIEVDKSELSALARMNGVKAIWPVVQMERPATFEMSEPDILSALSMTGADKVQSELEFTGEGIKVAVMDTGIDYNHPDLGGGFGPGSRVFTGWDFVGDDYNAQIPGSVPQPNPDPMDINGHGTHVAGIIGANGVLTGVAPDVTFGAYKVFGTEGSTTADVMMAAMEMALADDMDILNMSIGAAFQWPQYPTAVASSRLVNKGMVVVASIGNSGANGLYAAGAPGLGEKVIGVASFDNSHTSIRSFIVSPGDEPIGYGPATGSPLPPDEGSSDIVRTGTLDTVGDACSPLDMDLSGKTAIIKRGDCTFHEKALHAQNAGAEAVILYNNAPGRFSPTVAGTPVITIPVVAISDTEGALINNKLDEGPVSLTWTDEVMNAINPTGGLISSFSSYGLSPDLTLKPDIGAPGGMIYAPYPLAKGGYATLSGTSMSAPHVAGAVALLLEAHPRTPAQAVRSILQNTADPKAWWGNPGLGYLDQVHRQGAGMVQIDKAIEATSRVEPGKLSLGDSKNGPVTSRITISNNGSSTVTYELGHTPALSTGANTFSVGATTGFANVSFSQASVTVPAGGKATVDVTVTANPSLPNGSQYGGYIEITGGDQTYRVPYAGFKGDYQSITAINPTGNGFPWLASLSDGNYYNEQAGATFTMTDGDIPYVLLHLSHQVSKLRIVVKDADTGRNWHRAFDTTYMGRNSTANGFFALPFDGTTFAGNGNRTHIVPNGNYVLEVSALKALGDDNNPDHWETWTSPSFTIDRP